MLLPHYECYINSRAYNWNAEINEEFVLPRLLVENNLADWHYADSMLGWNSYDSVNWSTDIGPTQCLVKTAMTMSFGWETFDQHSLWLKQLWSCHLVNRHLTNIVFCWISCDSVIWSTDIWPTQSLVETALTLTFGQQTFNQQRVWLKQLW